MNTWTKIIQAVQARFRRKTQPNTSHWCLVGNIVNERSYDRDGHEKRPGTKQFSPGTKIYCLPARWGDGYERIIVFGRHQGSKRFVKMIISSAWVTNWRAKEIYQPEVLRRMEEEMQASDNWPWASKQEVEQYVQFLKERKEQQKND